MMSETRGSLGSSVSKIQKANQATRLPNSKVVNRPQSVTSAQLGSYLNIQDKPYRPQTTKGILNKKQQASAMTPSKVPKRVSYLAPTKSSQKSIKNSFGT